jgi:hypothetical protein
VTCFEERLGIIHLAMWGDVGYSAGKENGGRLMKASSVYIQFFIFILSAALSGFAASRGAYGISVFFALIANASSR